MRPRIEIVPVHLPRVAGFGDNAGRQVPADSSGQTARDRSGGRTLRLQRVPSCCGRAVVGRLLGAIGAALPPV
jgi:hypothetical protein